MNKFYLIFLPFILLGCGFDSFYEANLSCEEWKKEGGSYSAIIEGIKKNDNNKNQPEYLFSDTKNNFPMRKCQFDKETNQILGFELTNRKVNQRYLFNQNQRLKGSPLNLVDKDLEWEISKRFKY